VYHLRSAGFPDQLLEDLECAVGEALANSVEHGGGFKGRLHVRCAVDDDAVVVEIEDGGSGFNDQRRHTVESDECRGRGIHIMKYLMDDVNYHNGGTLVRLVKKVREEA